MSMKTVTTLPAAMYCPPEIEELRLSTTGILCESVNGMGLPDADYDDTEMTF